MRFSAPVKVAVAFWLVGAGAFVACSDSVETEEPPPSSSSTQSGGGGNDDGGGGSGTGATGGAAGGGGNGTGGDGGIAIIPDTGDDTCPGDLYELEAGSNLFLGGDTTDQGDDVTTLCGDDSAELVYHFVLDQPGTFKGRVDAANGSDLEPVLYLRSEVLGGGAGGGGGGSVDPCTSAEDEHYFGCWNFTSGFETFAYDITEPRDVYLFVDGTSSEGEFVLEVSWDEPTCGDGVTNGDSEECDDGNSVDTDGCQNDCTFEVVSLFDQCDGEPVVLLAGTPQVLQGSTTPYTDHYNWVTSVAGDECGFDGSLGKDRVFEVVPDSDGTITASVGYDVSGSIDVCESFGPTHDGCWDRAIYVWGPNQCGTGAPQIACSNTGFLTVEDVSFPVTEGDSYFVVIDSTYNDVNSYGSYNLHLSLE